jgi:carboxymethylenebutenolidase
VLAATLACVLLLAGISANAAAVQASDIHYGPSGMYHGYLVRPSGHGPFPGLVVIHEWWGLNDNIRNEATRLAESGYVALAVDLFGRTTTDPQEAMKLVGGLDQKAATANLLSAAGYLRTQPFVRRDRVGSMGWCFGGGQSLTLALSDPKLAAAVIYYGQPVTDPVQLRKIHAAVLGVYGEADQTIPIEKARTFNRALAEAGIRHEFYTYPGAGHAFANPTRGDSYRPEAAHDAWTKTLNFLTHYLRR